MNQTVAYIMHLLVASYDSLYSVLLQVFSISSAVVFGVWFTLEPFEINLKIFSKVDLPLFACKVPWVKESTPFLY
jgi:hypothetical protein